MQLYVGRQASPMRPRRWPFVAFLDSQRQKEITGRPCREGYEGGARHAGCWYRSGAHGSLSSTRRLNLGRRCRIWSSIPLWLRPCRGPF